jgi:hypothetical protein
MTSDVIKICTFSINIIECSKLLRTQKIVFHNQVGKLTKVPYKLGQKPSVCDKSISMDLASGVKSFCLNFPVFGKGKSFMFNILNPDSKLNTLMKQGDPYLTNTMDRLLKKLHPLTVSQFENIYIDFMNEGRSLAGE